MVQGVRVDPARFDPRRFTVRELFRLLLLSFNCRFRWGSDDAVATRLQILKITKKKEKRNNFINSKSKQKRKKFSKKVIRKKDGL
jgi:hypothetical protein